MSYDLLIKNARTRFAPDVLTNIGINGGKIAKISNEELGEAQQVIDAQGKLVTE